MILGLSATELAAWGTAAGTVAGSALLLRRRASKDSVAIAADRVESRFLDNVLEERDASTRMVRELLAQRQADMMQLATLEGDLRNEVAAHGRTRLDFDAFRRRLLRLYPETADFAAASAFIPDE